MQRLLRLVLKFAPPLLWMALIFYLSSIPSLELQGNWASWDFWLRKSAHMIEYGILFWLWVRALKGFSKRAVFWAILLSAAYAVSDEFHQYLTPTRDGKVLDVLIDLIGVLTAYLLLGQTFRPTKAQNPKPKIQNNPK